MSITKILYSRYVETTKRSVRWEKAIETMEEMLPHKEFCEVEAELNAGGDAENEQAFDAGFKAAVRMLMEAMG